MDDATNKYVNWLMDRTFKTKKLAQSVNNDRMDPKSRQQINAQLRELTKDLLTEVPLEEIDQILQQHGYLMIQEDGTPWSGFIMAPTEKYTRVTIEIAPIGEDTGDPNQMRQPVGNAMLVLGIYKHPTGRLEVDAYVS